MRLIELQRTVDDLSFELAETRRRMSNLIRPGTVKSFDPKTNKAVADVGFETHDLPVFNHAGTAKHWHPLKPGQQITLLAPDGDVANGFLIPGGFHDKNPAPSQSADEDIALQRGDDDKAVRFRTTDSEAAMENKAGKSSVVAGKDTVTSTAKKTIIDGDLIVKGKTYLGGEDADKPASMKGTIDTGGDADVSNLSTTVFMK